MLSNHEKSLHWDGSIYQKSDVKTLILLNWKWKTPITWKTPTELNFVNDKLYEGKQKALNKAARGRLTNLSWSYNWA